MARALFFFSFFLFLLSLLCNANIRLRVGRSAINSRHRHFSMFPSGADCQGEARISLTAGPHKTGEPSPGANSGSLLHHCRLCYCNICRGGSHCLLFNKSINKRRLQHVQYNATFFFFFYHLLILPAASSQMCIYPGRRNERIWLYEFFKMCLLILFPSNKLVRNSDSFHSCNIQWSS